MSDLAQDTLAFGGIAALIFGLLFVTCLKWEEIDAQYYVDALEATKGCEPCQLIVLSKRSGK